MNKTDVSMRQWLRNKERFADLFNGILFGGNQVIKPGDLTEADGESDVILLTKKTKLKEVQRYRDIVMRWHDELDFLLLACENQEKIHYAMPVRTMIYDGLSYTDQMRAIWQNLDIKEKNSLQTEELFSRFRKEDKLYPVITLVLYHGEKEWDGSRDLYGLFKIKNEEVKSVVQQFTPNYWINLIDVKHITEEVTFKTDLQIMFEMLKYRQNKKDFINYINNHKEYFSHMDYEAQQVMVILLKTEKMLHNVSRKRGEYDMCKALQDWYDEGVARGIERGMEQGIEQGIEQGVSIGIEKSIELLRDIVDSEDVIADMIMKKYELTKEEITQYM